VTTNWLGAPVVGPVAAAVGYFGKDLVERLKSRRQASRNEREEILRLHSLLEESRSVFLSQNYQARRLMTLLAMNHPSALAGSLGFDETFLRVYPEFTSEESELHSLIRSTSMNSMRRLNGELVAWLRKNESLSRPSQRTSTREALAQDLRTLQLHLNQWHDKYEALIANVRRSVVYLDDEKKQGVGFPPGLTLALRRVIEEGP
jgi:hypothetical protein